RLTGGMVSFTARNENDFGVSVDAILRLKGQAARRAKATKPSAAKAFLRAGHSVTVRIPLGHRRISLVHKHRRLRASLQLVVRDPLGHERIVTRVMSFRR